MSLFITGTGTGVGKTVVTAGLAALLHSQGQKFCVYKPIQTGCEDAAHPEDPELVKTWAGAELPVFNTYCFAPPVTPAAADPGHTIRPTHLLTEFKRLRQEYGTVLVEGAGGVRVPVAPGFEMIDLIRMLQLPVVVVASPWLGTINHILLTVDELLRQRLEVKGVVISGMPEHSEDPAILTLPAMLADFCPVPVLGYLPPMTLDAGALSAAPALQAFQALDLFDHKVL